MSDTIVSTPWLFGHRRLTDGVVVLRELREGDRAVVLSTMGDELVHAWLNMPVEPRDSDFDSLLRTARSGRATGERIDFAVTEAGEDVAVGAVIASRRHRDNYEIAYLAGPAGRGRGLMTRAVRLLCEWLLGAGVGRLELRTHPDNEPSQRLAERAGFRREGVERRSIWLHGRRQDAIVWSLLPGRPAMTLHSLRDRTLGVIPIRIALGLALLGAARFAGAASTSALLAFVSGVVAITFLLFNDPRSRFQPARAEPIEAPADARVAPIWRQAAAATLPSTVGLAVLALVTLVPQPTLTALLAGLCAGLGVAAALSLPRIDPALYYDPHSRTLYRR